MRNCLPAVGMAIVPLVVMTTNFWIQFRDSRAVSHFFGLVALFGPQIQIKMRITELSLALFGVLPKSFPGFKPKSFVSQG